MGATATKERVKVAVEGGDDDTQSSDVAKALEHVNGIVDKITLLVNKNGGEGKPPVEGGDDAGDDGGGDDAGGDGGQDVDVDTDTTDAETAKAAASLKSVLAKCGMDAGMMKKVAASLKAAGFDLSAKGAKGMPFPPAKGGKGAEKTTKSDDDVEIDAPLTMATLASAVQKAAAFTPARIKALQDAQDILKLVLEAVSPGTSPSSKVPAVQTHGNPSSVSDLTKPNTKPSVPTMKSADGEEQGQVVELLKSLSTAVGGLVDRVEAIEKARPGSNSVADQGGTDTNTQKSASMWKGVL